MCLNGLLIEGNVSVSAGNLAELRVTHTTIAPHAGTLAADANSGLEVTVERSISGAIRLNDAVRRLTVMDSIIDGSFAGGAAVVSTATGIDTSTVFGSVTASTLDASNSIFAGSVTVQRLQTGCIRFSYVPPGSLVPRRFRCQPDDRAGATVSVTPRFSALSLNHPNYAQLAPACPAEITAGADDEGEMGAFHFLQQTQRIGSLHASLDEHLRFGLEAGLFLVT